MRSKLVQQAHGIAHTSDHWPIGVNVIQTRDVDIGDPAYRT